MDMGFRWLVTGTALVSLQRYCNHVENSKGCKRLFGSGMKRERGPCSRKKKEKGKRT
jgi:hypothetical protein